MFLRAAWPLAVVVAATSAAAQSVHTVGPGGDFPTPQAAIDAAAPGDIVLLLTGFQTNVVIDKGLALMASGQMLMKPDAGPGSEQPTVRVVGVPAGQSVLLYGLTIFVGSGGAPAAVEIADCEGAVWIQHVFVDAYGAQALFAHDAQSLVCVDTPFQTNLIPALPDGTPQSAPGARLSAGTRAFLHDAFVIGSHGALQLPGNPAPTSAPDGGPGLVVADAQAKLSGTELFGGSGNSFFAGGCAFGGDGGAGLVTLDGPDAGTPAVELRDSPVKGGGSGFFDGACAPPPVPGADFDIVPGSVVSVAALPRRFDVPALVEPGQTVTLAFDGAAGDVALLFGSAAQAPALAIGAIDLHLAIGSLFSIATFTLPTGALDVPAVVPPLPAGLEAAFVPLQAIFVDAQGGKHASAPRVVVIH